MIATVARVTLGVFAVLAVMRTAHAQEIANGSFEEPAQAVAAQSLFAQGGHFKKWRVIGTDGNIAVTSGESRVGEFTFPAQDGKQWIDLTGDANKPAGVEQTVTTVPDTIYDLTFFVGNVAGGGWGNTSTVEVFVDGHSIGLATNSNGARLNRQVWQRFTMPFKATAASTIIGFINRDPPNDTTNGLDSVSLSIHSPQAACNPAPAEVKKHKKKSNPFADIAAVAGGVVTATDVAGKTSATEREVANTTTRVSDAYGTSAQVAETPSDCVPVSQTTGK